ncbi:phage tail tape measure protein [Aeromonas sobria]|uniref:phage tail tape measure protein n=1 Tax=Aeromonas sobria TaxID=646 RepID=UPI003D0580C3
MAWMEKLMMQVALVDQVTKPLAGINAQMDKVTKAASNSWGKMAGGAAAVAAGGLAIQATLMPAIEMDRALGEVASLGVAKDTLKALGQEALQFSVDYGKSATEFVQASYDIQSAIAGLSGNDLPAFTRASGVLAAATKADTGTITSYMGTMYGIFEQQANAMGKANWVEDVAGKTALAVQMFKTTGQGMADAFQGVQSTATSLGVSMDEQFAVLGTLQSTMGGAVAGTAYKSFLSAIPKAGKGLGLGFYDATGAMLPMVEILDQIKRKFGETLEGSDIAKIQAAFGETATPVILNLLEKTDQLKGSINALGNTHGMGKAEQMAASMTDQWQRLESVWFAIRSSAFSQLTPAVDGVIGSIVDAGGVLLRWTRIFPNLTRAISYTVMAVAGLGAFAGLWAILSGVGAILAALAWPILAVGAAIAVLVMWWDPIKAFFSGLISAMAPAISTIFEPWAEILPVIWDGVSSLIGIIGEWLGTTDEASGAFTNMMALGEAAGAILGTVFKLLLSPIWAVGKAIQWVLEKLNTLPGVNLDISSSMPDLNLQNPENINAPLDSYRQGGQSSIPSGGLGQQLIQANAAATTANQKPAKAMHIGEVHNHFQSPMTPGEMEQEMWITTP